MKETKCEKYCCDGECNHDSCCGKITENCKIDCQCHKDTPETMEERLLNLLEKQGLDMSNPEDEGAHQIYDEQYVFIQKEISLAISSHNKELVEKVEGLKKEGYAQYMASEKKHLERINFNEALDQVIHLITDSK